VILGTILLLLVLLVGVFYTVSDLRVGATTSALDSAVATVVAIGIIGLVWVVIAGPVSSYKDDICGQKAEGYGLDRHDWSIRHGCRVYLHDGTLVPEDKIRVTIDGEVEG
jgi:hypothetical protein